MNIERGHSSSHPLDELAWPALFVAQLLPYPGKVAIRTREQAASREEIYAAELGTSAEYAIVL